VGEEVGPALGVELGWPLGPTLGPSLGAEIGPALGAVLLRKLLIVPVPGQADKKGETADRRLMYSARLILPSRSTSTSIMAALQNWSWSWVIELVSAIVCA
jgi:hypothetical protein